MKLIITPILLTGLLLAFGLCSTTIAAPMEWTNTDGKVITGEFMRVKGDSVVISKGGKLYTIPFGKLSPESVEQAKRMGASQSPASPMKKIDISPTNLVGKSIPGLEKILGKPYKIVEKWQREYKVSVPSVSRIIVETVLRQNREGKDYTSYLEITYCFPKNTFKKIPDALKSIGINVDNWNTSNIRSDQGGLKQLHTEQLKSEGYDLWWLSASPTRKGVGASNSDEDALIISYPE